MGPTDIFLRRVVLSCCLASVDEPPLPPGADRSTAFIRELAVDADDTGCRGRELLRGGDSFGGGVVM